MRLFVGAILLLLAVAALAEPIVQSNGSAVRIFNTGPYFTVCEVAVSGRVSYWELYPGQGTVWYQSIDWWRCA